MAILLDDLVHAGQAPGLVAQQAGAEGEIGFRVERAGGHHGEGGHVAVGDHPAGTVEKAGHAAIVPHCPRRFVTRFRGREGFKKCRGDTDGD